MQTNTQEAVLSAYIASTRKRTPREAAQDAAELCRLANSLESPERDRLQQRRKQNLQNRIKAVCPSCLQSISMGGSTNTTLRTLKGISSPIPRGSIRRGRHGALLDLPTCGKQQGIILSYLSICRSTLGVLARWTDPSRRRGPEPA